MSGFAGLPMQTTADQGPMQQQSMAYYQSMSPEQLQEQVMRLRGSPQGQMAARVLQQKRIMATPQTEPAAQQAPPPGPQGYGFGGSLEPKGGLHVPERGINGGATPASPGGFLHTAGPGRSDNLHIHPHADSYVLPADTVSALGESNSLSGAKAWQDTMKGLIGPGGVPTPTHTGHRMGAPGGFGHGMPRAKGGASGADKEPEKVPIVAAGGEIVVMPHEVRAIGGGDLKRGQAILDAFVLHIRKRNIKELGRLKGPVKS